MGKGPLRKVVRAALYAAAAVLLLGAAVLVPRHEALAQSGGVRVPASGTVQALAVHASIYNKPGHTPAQRVDTRPLAPDPAALKRAKAAAADLAAAAGAAPSPAAAFPPGNFGGLQTQGLYDPAGSPADATGDIGPAYYVQTVNSQIGVYDRNLVLQQGAQISLASFAGVTANDCVFDPQIAWDQQAGRWLYAMLDQYPACGRSVQKDYLLFGWSVTSVPDFFCGFFVPTQSTILDYPKLGHDDNFMTIGANAFSNYGLPGGAFLGSVAVVIPKPAVGSTSCPSSISVTTFTLSSISGTGTPVPVLTTDSSSVGYIVAANDPSMGPANKLRLWHVSSSGGTPVVTLDGDVTVASYALPPNVPQPSTGITSCSTAGNCLDSLDGRLTQAVAHFDPDVGAEAIWTQHAVTDATVGTLSVERWYELIPGHTTPRQTGNINDSSLDVFNGAISPTVAGNEAVIFYNTGNGSSNGFVQYRAQRRNSSSPLGTMSGEVLIVASTVSINDYSCGINQMPMTGTACRWGAYTAARPDQFNAGSVWGTGIYSGSYNGGDATHAGWVSQIARMTPGCFTANTFTVTGQRGDILQFGATSTGCSNPLYEWWLQYPNGSWSLKQSFSSSSTWTVDTSGYPIPGGPMGVGFFPVHVWAVQSGDSLASYEGLGAGGLSLNPPDPCQTAFVSGGNPMGPTPVGSTVNFTASVGPNYCSTPVFEYWLQDLTGSWILEQSFSTNPSWSWDTTGLALGTYTIHLWANQRSDPTSSPEALGSTTVTLGGCTSASLSPPSVIQLVGSTVNLAANAVGCPNPLFEFFIQFPDGTWHLKQGWGGPALGWDTTGLSPGVYTVHVWANQQGGSLATWEAIGSATVSLSFCSGAGLSPSNPTQAAGSTINFTASSTGCTSPQYAFYVQDPRGTWTVKQGFGGPTFNWDTTGLEPGTYTVHAWVSASGSGHDSIGSSTVVLTGCTSASLSPPTVNAPAGSMVNLTASSSGCTAVYEFWVQDPSGAWMLKRGFGGPSFAWDTTGLPAGTYTVHAWANQTGAAPTLEVYGSSTVTLTTICLSASIAPPTVSQGAGTTVSLTASSNGCLNPRYAFYVQDPSGTWTLKQGFGGPGFAWDTSWQRPGVYTVHVWVNTSGNGHDAIGSATVTLSGCTAATVVPSSGSATVGTHVLFTVSTTTGCTTAVYEFWLQFPDGTWTLQQSFSTTNSWTWNSTGLAKGNYVIHVWVNNQGADTTKYETIGSATYTLT